MKVSGDKRGTQHPTNDEEKESDQYGEGDEDDEDYDDDDDEFESGGLVRFRAMLSTCPLDESEDENQSSSSDDDEADDGARGAERRSDRGNAIQIHTSKRSRQYLRRGVSALRGQLGKAVAEAEGWLARMHALIEHARRTGGGSDKQHGRMAVRDIEAALSDADRLKIKLRYEVHAVTCRLLSVMSELIGAYNH